MQRGLLPAYPGDIDAHQLVAPAFSSTFGESTVQIRFRVGLYKSRREEWG